MTYGQYTDSEEQLLANASIQMKKSKLNRDLFGLICDHLKRKAN